MHGLCNISRGYFAVQMGKNIAFALVDAEVLGVQIAEMIFQTRSSRLPPAIAVFAEFSCLHGALLITRVKNPLSEGFISKLSAGDFSYFICN